MPTDLPLRKTHKSNHPYALYLFALSAFAIAGAVTVKRQVDNERMIRAKTASLWADEPVFCGMSMNPVYANSLTDPQRNAYRQKIRKGECYVYTPD